MAIFRTIKNKNYTVVHNGFILDERLSLKAKGLQLYFLSRPDDWSFYTREIIRHCSNGDRSVTSAIKELIKYGYIERIRRKDETGKHTGGFEYHVYEIVSNKKANEEISKEIVCNKKVNEEISKEIVCNKKVNKEISKEIENNHSNPLEKPIDEEESMGDFGNLQNANYQNSSWQNSSYQTSDCKNAKYQNSSLVNTENILSTEYKINTEALLNTERLVSTENIKNTTTTTNIKDSCSNSSNNEDIYNFYLENKFGKLTKVVKEALDEFIAKYSKDMVKDAIIVAIKKNKYDMFYVEGILQNWKAKNEGGRDSVNSKGNIKKGRGEDRKYEEFLESEGLILSLEDL